MTNALRQDAGIRVPLICGAMYPCSNPELVAEVSRAGALGVVQPLSLTYVHGHDFREGLQWILAHADGGAVGMNALIEASSSRYQRRMEEWVEIALEEGVRFFVTSLGNPRWVVDRVSPHGGRVYHDVTERRWALKGRDAGVHGLIGVNRRAGGHPGPRTAESLLEEVGDLGLPVVAAGGFATGAEVRQALDMGYVGVQMGTRFIATEECSASTAYKEAILEAGEDDIVHTKRITGVPVAVIRTDYVEALGLEAGPVLAFLLRHPRTKRWARTLLGLRSLRELKASSGHRGEGSAKDGREYWQAGRSVGSILALKAAAQVVREVDTAISGAPPAVP